MSKFIHQTAVPRVLRHILFWIVYLGYFVIQASYLRENPDYKMITTQLFLTMWVDVGATYFTVYFLMQLFLLRRKYFQFGVWFLISAAIFVLAQRTILYYVTYPVFYPDAASKYTFWQFNFLYSFVNIYFIVGIFSAVKLFKFWFETQKIKAELENQNKTSELALLRSQINPHFLFNTLNNIDALVISDSEKASDAIIKLSEIMRYMLYESSDEKVPLEKEVNYLKSYISLQLLRLKDQEFAKFEIRGDLRGRKVAPMLFVPFVENAFKHGIKSVGSPGIMIILTPEEDMIKFEVENFIHPDKNTEKDSSSGIGLNNVSRRLGLIYPGLHTLTAQEKGNKFRVELILREK